MYRHVSKFPTSTVTFWLLVPVSERIAIKHVCCVARHDVKGKVFETKFTRMGMLECGPSVEIYKDNEVGVELFAFKVAVAGTLREIDVILEDGGARLHL